MSSRPVSDGSSSETAELTGHSIDDFLGEDYKGCFSQATAQLLLDDSKSVRCRFLLSMNQHGSSIPLSSHSIEHTGPSSDEQLEVEIDANGILIHDRISGVPTHVSNLRALRFSD